MKWIESKISISIEDLGERKYQLNFFLIRNNRNNRCLFCTYGKECKIIDLII